MSHFAFMYIISHIAQSYQVLANTAELTHLHQKLLIKCILGTVSMVTRLQLYNRSQ